MSPRPLIAVDWGTTSLRGARLNAQGEAIETRQFPQGVMHVTPGTFESVFNTCFGDWLADPAALCLISGMAGSRQGWQEAPYCPCPANLDELTHHLLWLQPGRIALVPGLSCSGQDALHTPDVMRGEEVQIWGALQLTQRDSATLVLPGTHSKWVQVEHGRVERFSTFMTGEIFALLGQQSILCKTLDQTAPFDASAFVQGVESSQAPGSLLHKLFAVRTLGLFDRMPTSALASYLSGLLIGDELHAQSLRTEAKPVLLIGSDVLTQRYALALQHLNTPSQCLGPEATWAGLFALAATC